MRAISSAPALILLSVVALLAAELAAVGRRTAPPALHISCAPPIVCAVAPNGTLTVAIATPAAAR